MAMYRNDLPMALGAERRLRYPAIRAGWGIALLAVISIGLTIVSGATPAGAQTSPDPTTSQVTPTASTPDTPTDRPDPTSDVTSPPATDSTDDTAKPPSTDQGGTGTGVTTGTRQDGPKNLKIIMLVILFGAVSLLVAMGLVLIDRYWAHESLRSLASSGLSATSTSTPAGTTSVALDVSTPSNLAVTGPTVTTIDDPVEVKATTAGAPSAVGWSVTPADGVSGLPGAAADTATITFTKAGMYEVQAASGSDVVKHTIVVLPRATGETEVPFLGAGWGAVTIGLTVAVLTAVLGLSGVVTSETVATVLGALVTFVVVKKADNAS